MHDADTLYYNGVIYTAIPSRRPVSALAVKAGRILALGDVDGLQACCGPQTQKIDLEGRFVMPGFIDSHLHPPGLALLDLYEVNLTGGKTDLIGLARVLWADPEWPQKVRDGREDAITHCNPACGDSCTRMITKVLPPVCASWPSAKKKEWRNKLA